MVPWRKRQAVSFFYHAFFRELLSITIAPADVTIYSGSTQQFAATGHYAGGSTADLTKLVVWTSSDLNALTISNVTATRGLATLIGNATAVTITARLFQIVATCIVTVGIDFTVLAAGTSTLPATLTFNRTGEGHSVRTGLSTVFTAGSLNASNTPRIGRATEANPLALVFEIQSENICRQSRNPTNVGAWDAGSNVTTTRPSGTAPDGSATTATQHNVTNASGFSRNQTFTGLTGQTFTFTQWVQSATGSAVAAQWRASATDFPYTAGITWQREQATAAMVASAVIRPASLLVQNVRTDLHQVEAGSIATEAIITAGATRTRNGERLLTTQTVTNAGQIRLYTRGRPKGSSSNYAGDMYLWRIDANNHARVISTTGAIVFTVGGVTYTTPVAMSWAAEDLVEIFVGAGGSVSSTASYRVGGVGSWSTLSTGSPTTFGTITQVGNIDVFCDGTSNQFMARWEKFAFYRSGFTPVL